MGLQSSEGGQRICLTHMAIANKPQVLAVQVYLQGPRVATQHGTTVDHGRSCSGFKKDLGPKVTHNIISALSCSLLMNY